jgi:hypothetical protein
MAALSDDDDAEMELVSEGRPVPIVVDGPNVAMAHGRASGRPSITGIFMCVRFWRARGHDCFAFVPAFWLRRKDASVPVTGPAAGIDAASALLLQHMVDAGVVVLTPPQDSDDMYMLDYARGHQGSFLVSNDMFRDHVAAARARWGARDAVALRAWCDTHVISYAWRGDEFIPNPKKAREAAAAECGSDSTPSVSASLAVEAAELLASAHRSLAHAAEAQGPAPTSAHVVASTQHGSHPTYGGTHMNAGWPVFSPHGSGGHDGMDTDMGGGDDSGRDGGAAPSAALVPGAHGTGGSAEFGHRISRWTDVSPPVQHAGDFIGPAAGAAAHVDYYTVVGSAAVGGRVPGPQGASTAAAAAVGNGSSGGGGSAVDAWLAMGGGGGDASSGLAGDWAGWHAARVGSGSRGGLLPASAVVQGRAGASDRSSGETTGRRSDAPISAYPFTTMIAATSAAAATSPANVVALQPPALATLATSFPGRKDVQGFAAVAWAAVATVVTAALAGDSGVLAWLAAAAVDPSTGAAMPPPVPLSAVAAPPPTRGLSPDSIVRTVVADACVEMAGAALLAGILAGGSRGGVDQGAGHGPPPAAAPPPDLWAPRRRHLLHHLVSALLGQSRVG